MIHGLTGVVGPSIVISANTVKFYKRKNSFVKINKKLRSMDFAPVCNV